MNVQVNGPGRCRSGGWSGSIWGSRREHTVRVLEARAAGVRGPSCVPTRGVAAGDGGQGAGRDAGGHPAGGGARADRRRRGSRWPGSSSARGHAVYRVSSAKAADLRRFYRRHAKSNGIDAETLARLPLADPDGLSELELAGADAAVLDRRVRACDRLTQQAARHKIRIKDLVRQLMPMTPLTGDLGKADLVVLERYADPRALLAAGHGRADRADQPASRGHSRARRGPRSGAAAAAAIELYGR